ncbi:1-deoxy-D-xylulose-5-phosphate synthase [Desulfovibrio inopinatus]|uniref:1-deoxy-D-xylulose-5-phosphate synthase n=1 Tax=Desulfovibrio inopinatus TaxID=102109 RepID=UPI00040716C9|nr:1-deoxy-D-xylulose-5-phosphate synthase [Desulfovibrio inopinatus]
MSQSLDCRLCLLPEVKTPGIVANMSLDELRGLADEVRQLIISTVSMNGGHLAPSLGVVELTLALLKAFHPKDDKIIWDVGHQAYAYKILTGRLETFHTLRTYGGVSGFPRPAESPYDHFGVGHSSTSISAALGMAMARDLNNEDNHVVAVIGDGSMTGGLAYEGLNQAGGEGRKLLVVLNDNEMSISPNVGALSLFLSRKLSNRWFLRFKKDMESRLKQFPFGDDLVTYAKRTEESVKNFFTPGMLFEAFRFNYVGPIDGHNIEQMVEVFEQVKELDGPVLVHALTTKGKGYTPAESNPTYFHGVGSFEPETGAAEKLGPGGLPSYTKVFGDTLCTLAKENKKIVAITAAMPEGTGLACFAKNYPEQFVDVGICEQHAVTFAAGLASQGFVPVVAIYSTFLQRSYDQIVHDVCLQNLHVVLCLDRGGLVGEDGATHHGAFDLSYLRHIPNITVMAPKDEAELQSMLTTAVSMNSPVAIRYPRGVGVGATLSATPKTITIGEGELLRDGADAAVIAIGSRVHPALVAAEELKKEKGVDIAVFNTRFVKPLPEAQILELAKTHDKLILVEENTKVGGLSSAVLECLADHDALHNVRICRVGLPDQFVEHGPQRLLRSNLGLDSNGIKKAIESLLA